MGMVEIHRCVFVIWQHEEEKLREFVNFLNGAHESIKFTAEWSTEKVNFLDVQVIKQGNKFVTVLFTKPTDTHQLLHRALCRPNHTKSGFHIARPFDFVVFARRKSFSKIGWEN